jgi:hypothetical protein
MFWSLPKREGDEVFTGTSGSLRLHPSEFRESRNEADAMFTIQTGQSRQRLRGVEGLTDSEESLFPA